MLPQIEHKTLMGAGFFASWWWNYGVTFINVPESSWQRSKDGYHKTAILTANVVMMTNHKEWNKIRNGKSCKKKKKNIKRFSSDKRERHYSLQWSVIDRCGHSESENDLVLFQKTHDCIMHILQYTIHILHEHLLINFIQRHDALRKY